MKNEKPLIPPYQGDAHSFSGFGYGIRVGTKACPPFSSGLGRRGFIRHPREGGDPAGLNKMHFVLLGSRLRGNDETE